MEEFREIWVIIEKKVWFNNTIILALYNNFLDFYIFCRTKFLVTLIKCFQIKWDEKKLGWMKLVANAPKVKSCDSMDVREFESINEFVHRAQKIRR